MKKQTYEFTDFMRDFPDEKSCWDYIIAVKNYPFKVWGIKKGYGAVDRAGKYYAPLKGTIFEGTHLPLSKWFFAIFICHYTQYLPIKDLATRLDISFITAMKIRRLLREKIDRRQTFLNALKKLLREGNKPI